MSCKVSGDYEPQKPESGFLFPAFKNCSVDFTRVELFSDQGFVLEKLFA
ncbi:MAG: hypothetical protein LUH07_15925 [Lachnospiraceae bacterium]|nr:hypothetical protein [Lachnospiraceae bacterium]